MDWVYLSPHFDDAALSCGGLIWEQVQAGKHASIWTVCAGDPPEGKLSPFAESLHARWDTGQQATGHRRREDRASCTVLGATYRHLALSDCIYRRSPLTGEYLYASEESLTGELHADEDELVRTFSARLHQMLPAQSRLVCPLAIGGHVDHRLVRAAADRLERPLWYYVDYPYIARDLDQLTSLHQSGWEAIVFPISEAGMQAWVDSVAAHHSQISTFWLDLSVMRAALNAYSQHLGGLALWQPTGSESGSLPDSFSEACVPP